MGVHVGAVTLRHLVVPTALARLVRESATFCGTPDCAVAYYDPAGVVIEKSAVSVPVFQKETRPERLVCYCFGHTVASVLDADRHDGPNAIVDQIMQACRQGLERCEETNPKGRCCLGSIRGLLRARAPAPSVPCGGCS